MELEFLGTGAGTPGKFRNVTSVALKLLDETNDVWLFDCGEATQHQILRTNLRPRKIDKIFITHLHGDHIFGLPGFLSSRSFQGGDGSLSIYGPKGVKDFVLTALKISDTHLGYKIDFHELEQNGEILNNDKFIVRAEKLDHRILSFGYRIEEKAHQGELQVEKLRELNIPSGPVYGQLKRGETVVLDDGRTINGRDFVGELQPGRIITILGDTRRIESIESLAQNADVLVHESTFGKNEGKLARNYYHSTNMQAASVAKKAHVKELLLTHISARYTGKMVKELERDARQIFANTKVVKDFDIVDIPMGK